MVFCLIKVQAQNDTFFTINPAQAQYIDHVIVKRDSPIKIPLPMG